MLTTTLATLVNHNPSAARVLEHHHLDYCCGGHQTLDEACISAGVDINTVLAELAPQLDTEEAKWTDLSPVELCEHIQITHHDYLYAELPRLQALMTKVVGVHAGRHPELLAAQRILEELIADIIPHMLKEDRVLFPMIGGLQNADPTSTSWPHLLAPISVMVNEHDQVGEQLALMRTVTSDFALPDNACASYKALYAGLEEVETDTHLHIHKENNVLFPRVLGETVEDF